jgi:acetylornithine/N-succinyldiaminopimelate aminotransferase
MLGLKLGVPNTEFVDEARANRLIVIGAGDNVVRLLPPLIIGEAEVSEALERLEATVAALEARASAKGAA